MVFTSCNMEKGGLIGSYTSGLFWNQEWFGVMSWLLSVRGTSWSFTKKELPFRDVLWFGFSRAAPNPFLHVSVVHVSALWISVECFCVVTIDAPGTSTHKYIRNSLLHPLYSMHLEIQRFSNTLDVHQSFVPLSGNLCTYLWYYSVECIFLT